MATLPVVEARLEQRVSDGKTERRREPRQLVREPAMLQVLRPQSGERFPVYILDVSDSGLGIWSPRLILPGALVQVRMAGSVVVMGDAVYAVNKGTEFYIGVRIDDVADCRGVPETAISYRSSHSWERFRRVDG